MNVNFKVFDKATVDGGPWYTVGCSKEVADWVRVNFKDKCYEHIDQQWHFSTQQWHFSTNRFDIPEKIYTLLVLRWT